MQLNMLTPTQLTKLFLPGMLAQRRGQVVNMASMAGYLPGPYMAIYFATKAYSCPFPRPSPRNCAARGWR